MTAWPLPSARCRAGASVRCFPLPARPGPDRRRAHHSHGGRPHPRPRPRRRRRHGHHARQAAAELLCGLRRPRRFVAASGYPAITNAATGSTVAKYAGDTVYGRLKGTEQYKAKNYEQALKRTFLATDEDLRASMCPCRPEGVSTDLSEQTRNSRAIPRAARQSLSWWTKTTSCTASVHPLIRFAFSCARAGERGRLKIRHVDRRRGQAPIVRP
jgi:hypothetical protein